MADSPDALQQMLVGEDGIALGVDEVSLLIQYIIIVEQVFSDFEVSIFHPFLRFLDGIGEHAVLDRLSVLHADSSQDVFQVVRSEETHQRIVQ